MCGINKCLLCPVVTLWWEAGWNEQRTRGTRARLHALGHGLCGSMTGFHELVAQTFPEPAVSGAQAGEVFLESLRNKDWRCLHC